MTTDHWRRTVVPSTIRSRDYFLLAILIIIAVAVGLFIIRRTPASPPSAAAERLDAHRFARLLIAEIKLYNREKVEAGLQNGDLYYRLRSEIDRSRQMYDQRVGARANTHTDYFHEELVRDLAGGDISKLGTDYVHVPMSIPSEGLTGNESEGNQS